MQPTENQLKKSRLLYIIEAAVEYLLTLLVSGSFLATLTRELGFSDSLTGILSSIVSLGCLFQLSSLTLRRKSIKRLAVVLSIINQVLFTLLYIVPLSGVTPQMKTLSFMVLMFAAYMIFNFIEPHKISWLMSLIDDNKRGTFTANKEIVSLISGMLFSFFMGTVIDHFVFNGETKTAFIIAAIVMFVLMAVHTCTLVFTVERERPEPQKVTMKEGAMSVLGNKKVLSVTVVYIFYYISTYSCLPFYGTYMINELGFSLQLVSILTMCASFIRIFVARAWGKYADRQSFAAMVEKCFLVLALSYVFVVFSCPANGVLMFILYNAFHGIAMGGINSALTNLVFDYASPESRAASLAVSRAMAGVCGFLTTLALSPAVAAIQKNGNSIFGITVYAQQIVTAFSLAVILLGALYIRKFLVNKTEKTRGIQ